MKTITITDDGARVVEAGGKDANGADTGTVWTFNVDQAEKHRPMFAAEIDALSPADKATLDQRRDALTKAGA